ncbi:hypothetical protein [Fibrobacter sp.]|uniref:hypothetical protein n=1 Tax=Fibrobacter sp. TaxID=35828 RepID=UPI00386580F4
MEKIGYIDEVIKRVKAGEICPEAALDLIRKLFSKRNRKTWKKALARDGDERR